MFLTRDQCPECLYGVRPVIDIVHVGVRDLKAGAEASILLAPCLESRCNARVGAV